MDLRFREKPEVNILNTSYEGICYQHDITFNFNLDHLALGNICECSPLKITLFPPFHTVLLVRRSLYSVHTTE